MLILDRSVSGRTTDMLDKSADISLPDNIRRQSPLPHVAVSELEAVRHYTCLSQKNMCIETNFYPLGSCTMKYNPRVTHALAQLPGFLHAHPLSSDADNQGLLHCLYDLQEMLAELTGLPYVSMAPMAGAQGELIGLMLIRAYHQSRGDHARCEVIIPDAAHGTNPASAAKCGYICKQVKTDKQGNVDLEHLQSLLSEKTAAIMLTNPSTLGVYENQIQQLTTMVRDCGARLYYDGANLNAIAGQYRPGDMGFDVVHINLHKTFATPHGCGGPGAGPIAVAEDLAPFLPMPRLVVEAGCYRWLQAHECPQSIGRLSAFHGQAGVLLRAFVYARLLGRQGFSQLATHAVLNANYVMRGLEKIGYQLAFPDRTATHEFIVSMAREKKEYGVTAMDVAKRLLDYGFHAPTVYFPTIVPEALLIEPTETESKQELDRFIAAMQAIWDEIHNNPDIVKQAPHTLSVERVDEVMAVKQLDVADLGA